MIRLIRKWLVKRKLSSINGWAVAARNEATARSSHRNATKHRKEKQRVLHDALRGYVGSDK